jgi:histidinol-phosphate aminotransferase
MLDTNLVLFDRNENRYGPAPACLDVLRRADSELLFNYTRAFQQGHYSELSTRLAQHHDVEESRVILGYGCEDILKEAVHHFLTPGSTILIPSASWWYYRAVADEVGGVTQEYPLRATPTHYEFDVPSLVHLHKSARPALVLLASPNNPTGNVLAREDLLALLEEYRGVPFVLDQAYFGLTPGEDDEFASLTDRYGHLMILRTFSKLYALAGARIGYAITGRELGSFQKFCARNLGYNRLSERLALAALDSPLYYEDIARRMASDRRRFYELFRACPGCQIYHSQANFILARLPHGVTPLLKRELDAQGLIVKFFTEPAFANHVRISLGTEVENERLLTAIRAAMAMPEVRLAAAAEVA